MIIKSNIEASIADNIQISHPLIQGIRSITLLAFILLFSCCGGESVSSSGNNTGASSSTPANGILSGSSLGAFRATASSITTLLASGEIDGEIIPLYEGKIPNSLPYMTAETSSGSGAGLIYMNVSFPTLTVYLPDERIATGVAVIYCPGGGYSQVQYGGGTTIAESLMDRGIAVFLLKYRLPSDLIMEDKSIGPLQDAQQAIKIVRQNAEAWNIDTDKIGIMGFSAGGHMASTAGTHFKISSIPNKENISLRPDFMILISSVISMDEEITHSGSRICLLGENPDEYLVDSFSNEKQVTKDTPPAWLLHSEADTIVSVENSILFNEALKLKSVPSELDLYPDGNHSLIWYLPSDEWPDPLIEWMEDIGVLPLE